METEDNGDKDKVEQTSSSKMDKTAGEDINRPSRQFAHAAQSVRGNWENKN